MTIKRQHFTGKDAKGPQDVVVAMFDILGFKRIVQQKDLEELNREYRSLLLLKQHAGRVPVLSLLGVDEWKSPSAVFSDTIVFWAKADIENTHTLLTTCSVLIAESLDMGWPIRGGIAAGMCVMDSNARVFIGRPFVDAYLLEGAQDWIGAAIHPSCFDHIVVGNVFANDANVVTYPVPIKKECSSRIEHAIEWGSRVYNPIQKLETLRENAGDQAFKYDNSIMFVKDTRANALG